MNKLICANANKVTTLKPVISPVNKIFFITVYFGALNMFVLAVKIN